MPQFDGMKLKDTHPLAQQFRRLMSDQPAQPYGYDALTEEEKTGLSMQRLFMTEEERMQSIEQEQLETEQQKKQLLKEEWGQFGMQLAAMKTKWEQEQFHYQKVQLAKNKNDKTLAKLKTPEEIEELREKRKQQAIEADKRKVFADKTRHGFYKCVGAFVKFGRWLSGADKQEKETRENPAYEVPGLFAEYWRLENMRPDEADPDFEEKVKAFNEKYGTYYDSLKEQYLEKDKAAQKEAEKRVDAAAQTLEQKLEEKQRADLIQKERRKIMEAATYTMRFGDSEQSQVEGGTKPNAFQYAQDGSRWLMKTNHSCIGAAAPNASIMTVAGYQVQKLVNPETAIEAFESKSKGVGTVSLQRMVDGVVSKKDPDYVDFFRFSRTPEAMEPEELKKIEKLAPQFLREYMTDFLLGNYDTKGENFLLCRDASGKLIVRGIDKEAAGRKDLVPEAQHMQKEKHFFDQDTVYNQLFRMFADGNMNFDLQDAERYIERIEQMSTEEYLKIYQPYFERQTQDHPDRIDEIRKNVTYRKEFIRVEARRFFGELVRQRMQNVSKEEAEELKKKYLGGAEDGIFLFRKETAEILQKEREKVAKQKEADAELLQEKVKKADEADQKSYNRRHAMYDFAKGIIMGAKELHKKITRPVIEEKRTRMVRISELAAANQENSWDDSLREVKTAYDKHLAALMKAHREALEKKDNGVLLERIRKEALVRTEAEMPDASVEVRMVRDEEIFLGGTKPMSQYIGADGSKWLAKQAVTCVGTTKLSGAYLTEIGANIQKLVEESTAVEAFVGQTQKHGVVSFQRRLNHVVSSKKLDLFQFSRHPELATQATVQQIEALMPQILREHVTDWLLCNFDTKGENFILTQEEGQPMVLHGIDKEAAFNKILDPMAWQMRTDYKPHANNTLYNVVFEKFANAEMDFDLNAVIPYVEKVMAMSDEEYMAKYETYFAYLEKKAGDSQKELDKVNRIRLQIKARKQGLREEYIRFFSELIERRCSKLHPDEAKELREKYYGVGDKKFRFPTAQE